MTRVSEGGSGSRHDNGHQHDKMSPNMGVGDSSKGEINRRTRSRAGKGGRGGGVINRLPGYLRVAVEAAMTVDTSMLVWLKVGLAMRRRSTAMRLRAVLSSTTTASALRVRRLRVSREL